MTNSNRIPNRLINEISPYLLQHAYNPVDWWPWCDEAFAKAKAEDKPVFLSIGYSTCHWCHVMERESFEDSQVAGRAKDFICIKVDKEERPDIDAVYMGVCQALTGSGGWPLTILMTPEQKPFFAGTYFPKNSRYGRPGLLELLKAVSEKWNFRRDELTSYGDKIAEAMLSGDKTSANNRPGRKPVETAALQLAESFDKQYGGFGLPPKFPMPHNLLFLLRCHYLGIADSALDMVEHSLAAMYKGGIFDHIGGGFSRYSTDKKWLAPHFEKMLYDNALIVTALTEFYTLTQKPLYKGIAEKTLDYIRREMTSPDGAFYSAQDADIDGEEGKFYTFNFDEVKKLLGDEDGLAFCNHYDVTPAGNFEGKNIPNLIGHPEPGLPGGDMVQILEKLYEYRKNRYNLHKDDKVLVSWNALMIAALAKAYRAFGTREYLDMATQAYSFVQKNMTAKDGSLFISYRNGTAKGKGLLDDYAFLSWACLELYESTFDVTYLERAVLLMEIVLTRFGSDSAGFYLSPKDGEALIFRPKEQFDGATPSGNSVAAWCLGRLAALTGEMKWRQAADNQLAFFGDMFRRQPTACTFALMALMQEVYPSQELVCLARNDTDCLALEMGAFYHPQTSVLVKTAANGERLAKISPFTQSYSLKQGEKTAYYLCQNQSCLAPVDSIEQVKLMITQATRA